MVFASSSASAKQPNNKIDGRPVLEQFDQSLPLNQEFEKAELFLHHGKLNEAVKQYDRILSLNPGDLKARIGKGDIELTKAEYDAAFQIFSEARLDAENSVVKDQIDIGLILSLVLAGKSKTPERDLKIALATNPRDTRVLNALGRMADQNQNWAQSRKYYHSALNTGNAVPRALNNLGVSLTLQGRYKEAIDKFKQAQTHQNAPESVAHNLSRAYLLTGDYRRALSLSGAEHMPNLYNDAGVFAMEQKQYALAKCLLKTASEISPVYHPEADANLKLANSTSTERANCSELNE